MLVIVFSSMHLIVKLMKQHEQRLIEERIERNIHLEIRRDSKRWPSSPLLLGRDISKLMTMTSTRKYS